MNEISKKDKDNILQILKGRKSGIDLPKPFEQQIFLFDSYVAGTSHVEAIDQIEPKLCIGCKLKFFREPNNEYDPQAIRVETETHEKVGYVPQRDNVVFSRLMDAGKLLFGRVQDKEWQGNWLKIKMSIYLLDR